MSIQILGLNEINGPLVALENVPDVGFDELVELKLNNGTARLGRVVQIAGSTCIIQVFEGTSNLSLNNCTVKFFGEPMKMPLSEEILGRVFNGSGRPLDGLGEVYAEKRLDINGQPMNPVSRVYPQNYINTGISSIDCLMTLIRGQKLPIFSGAGMQHDKLAVQIVRQSNISEDSGGRFAIVFAAMGVKNDVADYFRRSFEEAGVMDKVVMFLNLSNDPIIERILTPRCALTVAEYLAFEKNMHILVITTDMTSYCEALREFSSSKGEIPGRKGFPGYLYSDLASLYERAGVADGAQGSVTQLPILTMPNDDITHPVPDLTGYITEGQIVLDRTLDQTGIYPPVSTLPSLSRLMKDGIGEGFTRKDHSAVANQLFAAYANVQDIRALAAVIGEEELTQSDRQFMRFGELFEQRFISQPFTENRSIEETLDLGWSILSVLPRGALDRVDDETLNQYYDHEAARKRFGIE
ncbi:MAG: V-type ATP synthase subunit B [Oscillospiraceae bacterium]|jgi:V/A-type H+-transporting ATPase subunit B|nr:V-type ATP synthase subunit B [Oscillospiraceae bacterium]